MEKRSPETAPGAGGSRAAEAPPAGGPAPARTTETAGSDHVGRAPETSAEARDLQGFLDASPTPFHAVAEMARRLEAAGYTRLEEAAPWRLEPRAAHYVVRAGGSLLAFRLGARPPAQAGFRGVGAHTDSPNLRVKPSPEDESHGLCRLRFEPYGGLLLHTWLDRDLSLAGRVSFEQGGALRSALIDFKRPLLRIPNLAIHLSPELRKKGLQLNMQQHTPALLGLAGAPPFRELLAQQIEKECGVSVAASAIHAFDLMAYDAQGAAFSGAQDEFLHSGRLDNLASCHAALSALLAADAGAPGEQTRFVVCYDHEEVGSRSMQGAAGSFLSDVLKRAALAGEPANAEGGDLFPRAAARSLLISADMAHAVHPNYADRHESGHRPQLGAGPVIKVNANQSYAGDAGPRAFFSALCREAGTRPQHFVSRSDMACGGTIGPIVSARAGIRSVDVGSPMLSMHSCREMMAADDVAPMIRVLRACFESTLAFD